MFAVEFIPPRHSPARSDNEVSLPNQILIFRRSCSRPSSGRHPECCRYLVREVDPSCVFMEEPRRACQSSHSPFYDTLFPNLRYVLLEQAGKMSRRERKRMQADASAAGGGAGQNSGGALGAGGGEGRPQSSPLCIAPCRTVSRLAW